MSRLAGGIALMAMGSAVALLGSLWVRSRTDVGEAPRWNDSEFVRLAGDGGPGATRQGRPRGLWVLPVNPSCSHCVASLAEFRGRAAGHEGNRLVVLIVDAPRRPDASTVERLGEGVEVWWDARSVWRGRWGYRVYGEPLCFDGSGLFLGLMKWARPIRGAGPPAKGGGRSAS